MDMNQFFYFFIFKQAWNLMYKFQIVHFPNKLLVKLIFFNNIIGFKHMVSIS